MTQFLIWEGYMADLEKKVATIRRKCNKYGCDFHFEKIGEEFKEVTDNTGDEPRKVTCKYIICEVDGTAVINGWKFVASVDHTEKGNIFNKALTDVEIPDRYRTSDTYCEHCKSRRRRKGTFIVMNEETGEFKQVGKSCLRDFTNGMSATWAAYMASLKDVFAEAEERPVGGGWGYSTRYYDTEEFLRYTAETIRHFGFSKSDNTDSTKSRAIKFFNLCHGNTKYWSREDRRQVEEQMEQVGFNPESEEAKKMTQDAMEWIISQEATNDYLHNLKTVVSLDYVLEGKYGLLVSLFPTWDRELEAQAKREAEAEAGKASEHVGEIGDRITVDVKEVKCITSWESCYNGYRNTTTYVWKITGEDGNVYTWKTSRWLDEEQPPKTIKGTVKKHNVFREVKQTELTRCKVA